MPLCFHHCVLHLWSRCDRQLPVVAWFHTLAAPPPPSTDSSLGNHRPPGWRLPVCLRAGQPAQSIPLHFLSICSGLFINNYCLAELQCACWQGQGERLCDLFPPRGGLGSHIQTLGQTKEANTHNITPGSFLCGNTLTACQSQTLNCSCL